MLPTILICLGLAAAIGGAIYVLVRDKKQGKSSCGCGCSTCPMSGACHGTADKSVAKPDAPTHTEHEPEGGDTEACAE